MKNVELIIKKIIKKTGDDQAFYTYGVEYSSKSKTPDFRAMVKFSKEGVPPILAGAPSENKLENRLREIYKGADVKDIAIKYCEGQIKIDQESIKFHEGLIRDYENKSTELPTK